MMKRIAYSVFYCMVVLWFTACNNDTPFQGHEDMLGSNRIILGVSSGKLTGKAVSPGVETAVKHLDVLIFEDREGIPDVLGHHERVPGTADAIVLRAERKKFEKDKRYWVYLIANTAMTEQDMGNKIKNYTDLAALQQTDAAIHLTGIAGLDVPQVFLMDGVAYLKENAGTVEPAKPSAVVLYNGVDAADTELGVVLRRAAAKVVVNIEQGDKVVFGSLEGESAKFAGYYFRNMPVSTSLVPVNDFVADLKRTEFVISEYSRNDEALKKITVTGYMYSHSWKGSASSLEKETRLIVGIPLTYKENPAAEGVFKEKNFYQIPLSRSEELMRNYLYEVNIKVNAPGGEDPQEPVELKPVSYRVEDWSEIVGIAVGGEENRPKYLTVNKENMEMYNITVDSTTLQFTSSSAVTVEMVRACYVDKFGQEQEVSNSIKGEIKLIPDSKLAGNIKIQSPLPTNNSIRYIDLKITNEDNVEPKTVRVAQYPLEYITNIQGWYSYRSDFGGTNWETLNGLPVDGNGEVKVDKVIIDRHVGCNWSNGKWEYNSTGGEDDFASKVATPTSGGKSEINYYRWDWVRLSFYKYKPVKGSSISGLNNARMYHVRITASSGDYTVGVPRMTAEGITDPGGDNAKLVSPSFMIASQLGAVLSFDTERIAADHCKNYVEVYKDESTGKTVHLDDWRLPTEAELKIIMKFQDIENSAIDDILTGRTYWSASGEVNTGHGTSQGTKRIRCVRDAYKTPEGK